MNLYNRMMTAEFAFEILEKKEYVFVCAKNQSKEGVEKRGDLIKESLKPSKYYEIEYFRTELSTEEKIEDGFRILGLNNFQKEFHSLEKDDMYELIKFLFSASENLVVDYTLMNTRFLGSFCAILSMIDWKEVYFCYTEPGKYKKNEDDKYDLKNVTMGFNQIPNLETFSDSSTECDWVIFLGFEGSRLMRLQDESPASKRYLLPHISIPAMRTNWHNVAMNANQQFFELKINDQEKLDYVSAINPFETYRKLNHLKESNPNVRLVISPIGPKPVMLGCIMYVLENENEMLLFDNPYQEGSNTVEYGDSHFYDLSQFIHSVKNKRYLEEEE